MQLFADRTAAGRALAHALKKQLPRFRDLLVLALPRGGVPVAFEVARALGAELDLMIVRKLGLPWQPELAMGAIASGGVRVMNEDIVQQSQVSSEDIDEVAVRETAELERRSHAYRGQRPQPKLQGRTVILVDDGVATGATMLAAIQAVRRLQPERIVVAVPVSASETLARLEQVSDQVICLEAPLAFYAIGQWYEDFSQTSDEEVRTLLANAWSGTPARRDTPEHT